MLRGMPTRAALVLFAVLLFAGGPALADDAAEADALVKELGSVTDEVPLQNLMERVPPLYNKLEDPARRTAIRAALGAILKNKDLQHSHVAVFGALMAMNDPSGVWEQIQAFMPTTKDKELSDHGLAAYTVLSKQPAAEALPLLAELTLARAWKVYRGAVHVLGFYGSSPERAQALAILAKALARLHTSEKRSVWHRAYGGALRDVPHIVEALCRLTGRQIEAPAVWLEAWKKKRKRPDVFFDPEKSLGVAFRTPWKRMRAQLGTPKKDVKRAIDEALAWLAAHQCPDGCWDPQRFMGWCNGKAQEAGDDGGAGEGIYDLGVTALALTAFLVAGYDGTQIDSRLHRAAWRATQWLLTQQDEDGCFGKRVETRVLHEGEREEFTRRPQVRATWSYNHALATLAVIEALGMTGRSDLREPARKAVALIGVMRNPYFAWRYGIKPGDNDTSISFWMVLATGCAQMLDAACIKYMEPPPFDDVLDEGACDGALAWLDRVTDSETGRVGYSKRRKSSSRNEGLGDRFPDGTMEPLTAAGMYMRLMCGRSPKNRLFRVTAKRLAARLPVAEHRYTRDLIYWHTGSLALHAVHGTYWKKWRKALEALLLERQVKGGDACELRGSWDPDGPWGSAGGRVYSTAINTLTLLTPWRYPKWRK